MTKLHRCAEPGCYLIGKGEYCRDHKRAHAHDGAQLVLAVDEAAPVGAADITPLPCSRCSSSLGISYGDVLCVNCTRDDRRRQYVPDPDPDREDR